MGFVCFIEEDSMGREVIGYLKSSCSADNKADVL